MTNKTKQTDFNLSILHEALTAIAAPSNEQIILNKNGMKFLDDIFDFMPLDYLPWLKEKRIVNNDFSEKFVDLYKQIEEVIGDLDFKERDGFILQNTKEMQEWRNQAKTLKKMIKT